MLSKWKNLTISKKLYIVYGAMVSLVIIEFISLAFTVYILSSTRAFIEGEGKWSKAQKDAVHNLQSYTVTTNKSYYEKFWNNLQVLLYDREVRLEVESGNPDMNRVYKGLLNGGIHSDDVESMASFFIRFRDTDFFVQARNIWAEADSKVDELMALAYEVNTRVERGGLSLKEQQDFLIKIGSLNENLTILENQFSAILAHASRTVEKSLSTLLLMFIFVVGVTSFLLVYFTNRHLSSGIAAINSKAKRIGDGNFDQKLVLNTKDELGELDEVMNTMVRNIKDNIGRREDAEEANELKSLFLANMSHELRTPLNAVVGFAELLENKNLSEEKRSHYVKIIQKTGRNLTEIINDILDISKIESGYLDIRKEDTNIREIIEDVENMLRLKSNEKGIEFEVNIDIKTPHYGVLDPCRLKQILINLITNAIKFTEKGKVSLDAYLENDYLVFDVRDTGEGIEEKYHELIFETFQQGESGKTRGTGLGLPLSKSLAELMGGGVLLVNSKRGEGSHFRAFLKYYPVTNQSIAKDGKGKVLGSNLKVKRELKDLKILIVDDAEENRALIMAILEEFGCKVACASNGKEGVELAMKGSYDIVIMDIQMPVLDGYQATEKLRGSGHSTPIIALTGYSEKEAKDKCLSSGFDDILIKPIYPNNLVEKIVEHTGSLT